MSVFAEEEKKKEKNVKPAVQPKETVQRDLSDVNGPEGGMLPESVSAKIQSKRGTGQRLSDRNLQQYSQKFGRDMSDVHVHTDAESDSISRSLNARAFTIGSDVFLTKGINPDGSGRDAQTMAHELTHVVQQKGHAGSGRLKLGAADTAQEHEAESTAQREFSPELDEEEGTIQRGFFKDLGSSVLSTIGHNALSMIGMEDAYNATFGGKHKVQHAVDELNDQEKKTFDENEELIMGARAEIGKLENQLKEIADNDPKRDPLIDQYNKMHKGLESAEKENIDAVKSVDSSITESDMEQFRTDDVSSLKGMLGGKLASSIMGGFTKESQRGEARQAALQKTAHSFAKDTSYSGRKAKYEKTAAGKAADEAKEKEKAAEEEKKKAAVKAAAKAGVQGNGGGSGGANGDLAALIQQLIAAFMAQQKNGASNEQKNAQKPPEEEDKKSEAAG